MAARRPDSKNLNSQLRIIVLGYLVRGPIGGLAWHYLQYLTGLAGLNHDVYFIEDSDDYASCYNPKTHTMGVDPTYGLQFINTTLEQLGFENRWAYYDAHTDTWHGSCADKVDRILASADIVINVSGVNPLRPWMLNIPVRVLIDTDPAFTQIRHLTDPNALELAKRHTHFFTFGHNIDLPIASIPDDQLPWLPTRQPVVIEHWPPTPGPIDGKFTSVMQWDSYSQQEYDGRVFGMKSSTFMPYINLPSLCHVEFELAIGSATAPRALLESKGWSPINPLVPTRNPWTYQAFIQQSKAEFSTAKHGYVITRSGWFSERSCAYMISGRPILVQDTGFSEWLDTGSGALAFNNLDQALAGIDDINSRYAFHCRAARELAITEFNSTKVLSELLDRTMSQTPL